MPRWPCPTEVPVAPAGHTPGEPEALRDPKAWGWGLSSGAALPAEPVQLPPGQVLPAYPMTFLSPPRWTPAGTEPVHPALIHLHRAQPTEVSGECPREHTIF